jgi:ATP-dependent RNA helicase DeaD
MTEHDEAGTTTAQDGTSTPVDGAGFAALGLSPELVATLSGLGYEEPTPIQQEAIPALLEGRVVVGEEASGTG